MSCRRTSSTLSAFAINGRGYSIKKPEYLMYQEEGMDEAFHVVSDVAVER
jgi:hypothetical protein